jgi:hypothetical protein
MHDTITLDSGKSFTPLRAYRLKGGYRLLVTAERSIWQEFRSDIGLRYSLLATRQDWCDRCPLDDTINRANVCLVANFSGHE